MISSSESLRAFSREASDAQLLEIAAGFAARLALAAPRSSSIGALLARPSIPAPAGGRPASATARAFSASRRSRSADAVCSSLWRARYRARRRPDIRRSAPIDSSASKLRRAAAAPAGGRFRAFARAPAGRLLSCSRSLLLAVSCSRRRCAASPIRLPRRLRGDRFQFALVSAPCRASSSCVSASPCGQALLDRADLLGLRFQPAARALLIEPQLRKLRAGLGQLGFGAVALLLQLLRARARFRRPAAERSEIPMAAFRSSAS